MVDRDVTFFPALKFRGITTELVTVVIYPILDNIILSRADKQ